MGVERKVFEQIDFDYIINHCAAVKEKRILGLKHFIRIIRKWLLFLISMFSLATFDIENLVVSIATSPLSLNNRDKTGCSGSATTISFRI